MIQTTYLLGGLASFALTIVLLREFVRGRTGPATTAVVVFLPYVFLGMVKLRCRLGAGFSCGWMSLHPGVTWHILPTLVVVTALGIVTWKLGLLDAVKPLAGGWLALAWYSLPVSIIHPPTHGGPCPRIAVICHDMPLFGMGGLGWWLLPFVAWAGVTVLRSTGRLPGSRRAGDRRIEPAS